MTKCMSLATSMKNNFKKLYVDVARPNLANCSKYHLDWIIDVACEHPFRYMLSNENFESIHG